MEYTNSPPHTWLGQRMSALTDDELRQLFLDVTTFHRTGILRRGSQMRALDAEFGAQLGDEQRLLRTIEDALLYEMGRRYYDLSQLPAADVRHGRWLGEPVDIDGHTAMECSACHRVRIVDDFCSACGACMDEDD